MSLGPLITLAESRPHGLPHGTRYLFIDGAYLRKVLEGYSRRYFGGEGIPVHPEVVATGYKKGFYYDCLPSQGRQEPDGEYERRVSGQEALFQRFREVNGVHVVIGHVRGRGSRARQKGVDVAIAVDMLTHAYRRNMTEAVLLAGDLDFLPLVQAAVRDGMHVKVIYEPRSASKDLIYAADTREAIDFPRVLDWAGHEFRRRHKPKYLDNPYSARPEHVRRHGRVGSDTVIEVFDGENWIWARRRKGGTDEVFSHTNRDLLEEWLGDRWRGIVWDSEAGSDGRS